MEIGPQVTIQRHDLEQEPVQVPPNTGVILVDGSWEISGRTGVGMVIFDEKGNLVHAKGTNLTTKNSLEGEAMAVFGALNYIMEGSIGRYRIYSDCKILVQAIERESINELTHCQAVRVVVRCIQLCKDLRDMVSIKHVRRNALIQPHALANWATRQNSTFAGVPGQQFMKELHLQPVINKALYLFQGSTKFSTVQWNYIQLESYGETLLLF